MTFLKDECSRYDLLQRIFFYNEKYISSLDQSIIRKRVYFL